MDDYFCIFMFFYKAGKISVLDRWAELVVKQLTQLTNYANKSKVVDNGGRIVFT